MHFPFPQLAEEEEIMYQKIMVPLDGSELAECVLPHVEAIASGCHVGKIIFGAGGGALSTDTREGLL